jgi:hypothetical protein
MGRLVGLALALVVAHFAAAQMLYNPNDERFKSLYLEKTQSDYRMQKQDFQRQKLLHDKGLISERDYSQSEASFKAAQITYQQAILSLAFEQPHITIDNGVKYQGKAGPAYPAEHNGGTHRGEEDRARGFRGDKDGPDSERIRIAPERHESDRQQAV